MSPAAFSMRGVIGGALVLFALALLVALGGCAGTQLDRATTGATIARAGLDAAAGAIETACSEERVTADPGRLVPCVRAVETHDAARAAWETWAAALLIAHSDDSPDVLAVALEMAGPVLELYAQIAEALRAFGVNVPSLPASLGGES